jgi:hypothetical protein
MDDRDDTAPASLQPTLYRIRVKGELGREWADWFGGLRISAGEGGETILTGSIIDQAALYGVLRKVRNLGMPLLSVGCVAADQTDAPDGIADVATNNTGGDHGNEDDHHSGATNDADGACGDEDNHH